MPLEKTFQELSTQMHKLRDRVHEVELTLVEDKPVRPEPPAFIDDFEDAVEDLLGWIEEGLRAAAEAERSVGHPVDLDLARRSLAKCQEVFGCIEKRFSAGLASYERLSELNKMGQERRGEWLAWTNAMSQGLDHCHQPLEEVKKALATCWEAIAERVGMTSISVQATNIGQQITVRESKDAVHEGIT